MSLLLIGVVSVDARSTKFYTVIGALCAKRSKAKQAKLGEVTGEARPVEKAIVY